MRESTCKGIRSWENSPLIGKSITHMELRNTENNIKKAKHILIKNSVNDAIPIGVFRFMASLLFLMLLHPLQSQNFTPYSGFGSKTIAIDTVPITYVDDSGRVAMLERVPSKPSAYKSLRYVAHFFDGKSWNNSDTLVIYRKSKLPKALGVSEISYHKNVVYLSVWCDSVKNGLDTCLVKWEGGTWKSAGNGLGMSFESNSDQIGRIQHLWIQDTLIVFSPYYTRSTILSAGGQSVGKMAVLDMKSNTWKRYSPVFPYGFQDTGFALTITKIPNSDTLVFNAHYVGFGNTFRLLDKFYNGNRDLTYIVLNGKVLDTFIHNVTVGNQIAYLGKLNGYHTWLGDNIMYSRVGKKWDVKKLPSVFASNQLLEYLDYTGKTKMHHIELRKDRTVLIPEPELYATSSRLIVFFIQPTGITQLNQYSLKARQTSNYRGFHGIVWNGKYLVAGNIDSIARFDPLKGKYEAYKPIENVFTMSFENFSEISGTVYDDQNADAKFNSTDTGLNNVMVMAVGKNNVYYTTTDDNGAYKISFLGADTLAFEVHRIDRFGLLYKQSFNSNLAIAKDTFGTSFHWPMRTTNVENLEVMLQKKYANGLRRGDTIEFNVSVRNNCKKSYTNIELRVGYDTKLSPFKSAHGFSAVSGKAGLQKITIASLPAKQIVNYKFKLYVNQDSNQIKDLRNIWAFLPGYTDSFNGDNEDTIFGKVVTAYDPNLKHGNPEGEVTHDVRTVNYTVQFQNTGSSYARKVVVRDTLDGRFPLEKVYLTESKHKYKLTIENGRILVFTFSNINLKPIAENPDSSISWFRFQLSMSNNLQVGDSITNRVGIYFDYEPAVITPWTVVKRVAPKTNSAVKLENAGIGLHPNPANNRIFLQFKSNTIRTVQILNVEGELLKQITTSGTSREIELNQLPAGIYFIKTSLGETGRFIKLQD